MEDQKAEGGRQSSSPGGNRVEKQSEGGSERRAMRRHPFVALAELTGVGNNQRVSAQTTQLSATGCYLGAANPFPEGSHIRIRLMKDGETFESAARVLHVHAEFGMGVIFENVPPEQQRVVDSWLAKSQS
ncbi:MAG: PilZ domain-containing protein [Candidatus Acidiferrales bacterium]